ncbi:hypothetical protein JCM11641_001529 [Rhodosporidiobolus odoratus]
MRPRSGGDGSVLAPPPPYDATLSSPLIPHYPPGPSSSTSLASHPAFKHLQAHLGLPSGFFLLRNRAQGKTLDLLHHKTHEGAPFGVHPVKKPTLRGLSLQHNGNNQLFFLDWDGHLVAAAASREVDVVDGQLSLAHPHPVAQSPSALSHPLPRFRLDPETHTLHVVFSSDPLHRGPHAPCDWRNDDYIVEVLPRRLQPGGGPKPPNVMLSELSSKAGGVLSGLGSGLGEKFGQLGLFGSKSPGPSSPTMDRVSSQDNNHPLPPLPVPDKPLPPTSPPLSPSAASSTRLPLHPLAPAEQDLAESDSDSDSDSDTEPTAYRPTQITRLPRNWRDKFPSAALHTRPSNSFGVTRWPASSKELRRWRRRQWEVVPVLVQPVPAAPEEEQEQDLPGTADSDSSSSSSREGDYGNESDSDLYGPAARQVLPPQASSSSSPPPSSGTPDPTRLLSTISAAASTAQAHATSAATVLGGMISGAFALRDADSESASGGEAVGERRNGRGLHEGSGAGGRRREMSEAWGDAAELKQGEIEGLGVAKEDSEAEGNVAMADALLKPFESSQREREVVVANGEKDGGKRQQDEEVEAKR